VLKRCLVKQDSIPFYVIRPLLVTPMVHELFLVDDPFVGCFPLIPDRRFLL
jgi:hypothetical protein